MYINTGLSQHLFSHPRRSTSSGSGDNGRLFYFCWTWQVTATDEAKWCTGTRLPAVTHLLPCLLCQAKESSSSPKREGRLTWLNTRIECEWFETWLLQWKALGSVPGFTLANTWDPYHFIPLSWKPPRYTLRASLSPNCYTLAVKYRENTKYLREQGTKETKSYQNPSVTCWQLTLPHSRAGCWRSIRLKALNTKGKIFWSHANRTSRDRPVTRTNNSSDVQSRSKDFWTNMPPCQFISPEIRRLIEGRQVWTCWCKS